MLLNDFLNTLNAWLAQEQVGINESGWQIQLDPLCRRAEQNQLLIGVGDWGTVEQPTEHPGVCLNNKGLARRFGRAKDPATVTELVLDPPPELAAHWRAVWGREADFDRRLSTFTLVVEDATPDSVLALLLWLAFVNGVTAEVLHRPEVTPWVEAARRWELTGMVVNPYQSWAALLSALSHSYFAPEMLDGRRTYNIAGAWHEVLHFTVTLLLKGVMPDTVLELWELQAYRRATALLRNEEQDYCYSLSRSTCLQLQVPVAGPKPRKEMLVDAYLTVETWPSGARKLFARMDRTHTYTGQGFAIMGIYRPDPRVAGIGDDMVVSVNPLTGLSLQDLWEELERLENERWEGQRPTDNPRPLVSYSGATGYTQPWWDDHGRYTLLGAPRRLPDGRLGSRLLWPDVVNALWRVYSPVRSLRVEDALHGGPPIPVAACRRKVHRYDGGHYTITKYFLGMRWLKDIVLSGALLDLPTVQRYLAALIARQDETQPVMVEDLPQTEEFTLVALHGGFAIMADQGVLVFDDWRTERLRVEKLDQEFERVFQTLSMVRRVEAELDAIFRERTDKKQRPTEAVLGDLVTLRSWLTEASHQYQPGSHWADMRAFREALENRWGVGDAIKNLHTRISQFEDTLRTASALKTQRFTSIISTIGLPFLISGPLTNFLKPWFETTFPRLGDARLPALLYLGLTLVLIGLIHIVLKRWLFSAQERQQKVGKGPHQRPAVSDSASGQDTQQVAKHVPGER